MPPASNRGDQKVQAARQGSYDLVGILRRIPATVGRCCCGSRPDRCGRSVCQRGAVPLALHRHRVPRCTLRRLGCHGPGQRGAVQGRRHPAQASGGERCGRARRLHRRRHAGGGYVRSAARSSGDITQIERTIPPRPCRGRGRKRTICLKAGTCTIAGFGNPAALHLLALWADRAMLEGAPDAPDGSGRPPLTYNPPSTDPSSSRDGDDRHRGYVADGGRGFTCGPADTSGRDRTTAMERVAPRRTRRRPTWSAARSRVRQPLAEGAPILSSGLPTLRRSSKASCASPTSSSA